MTVHRYGVLDADGYKVNTILIDDQVVKDYWPGYGAKLIDEGPAPEEPKAEPPPPRPADFGLLDVQLAQPMNVGDRIDFKSGKVTVRAEPIAVADVLVIP